LIACEIDYKEIVKRSRAAGFPDALVTFVYIEPFDTPPVAGV
jgi:hypothetical protein